MKIVQNKKKEHLVDRNLVEQEQISGEKGSVI
jgi:hypothetical protein